MAKKYAKNYESEVESDSPEVVEALVAETVKMIRYDRTEHIDVPADQVDKYKKSDWKVV
tara:strand:- start:9058 stop:9234 length:177 start_codon:yes stop_codon:yes gene_type:complete